MSGGTGCDRREMRDTEDLSVPADLAHFTANGLGSVAADVGVHLVEDENRDGVLDRKDGLEGQHHASHFTGGGDGAEGARGFAGVRCKLELHLVITRGEDGWHRIAWRGGERGGKIDFEVAVAETELGELIGDKLLEGGDDLATCGGELLTEALEFGGE